MHPIPLVSVRYTKVTVIGALNCDYLCLVLHLVDSRSELLEHVRVAARLLQGLFDRLVDSEFISTHCGLLQDLFELKCFLLVLLGQVSGLLHKVRCFIGLVPSQHILVGVANHLETSVGGCFCRTDLPQARLLQLLLLFQVSQFVLGFLQVGLHLKDMFF